MEKFSLTRVSRPRIQAGQRERIYDHCLKYGEWRTLAEIATEAESRGYRYLLKTEEDLVASVRYHLRALIKEGLVESRDE